MPHQISATQYQITEWFYHTAKSYNDPFNDIELDIILTHSDGQSWRIPAYCAGGNEWRVRFAPPKPGTYKINSVSSDQTNSDFHGQECTLEVSDYRGNNHLLKHGPLKVADSRRTFKYEDGTPFFWLGDTWWMGLCKRLAWPVGAYLNRWKNKGVTLSSNSPRLARKLAGIICKLQTLFILSISLVLGNIIEVIYGDPLLLRIVVVLPLLAAILTVGLLVFTVLA